jgi:AraC-like DNA-binding protein/quercetin dioxygenase-like cupin family protein
MSQDPLGDVLRMVRISGGVFLSAELTAPWSVTAAVTSEECMAFDLEPRQVIAYHYVVDGCMHIAVGSQPSIKVSAGEIILLPQNDRHVVSSAPDLPPMVDKLIIPPPVDGISRVFFGGGGERCHMLCGFLSSEDYNPLFATLPARLKIDVAALGTSDWIESSMQFAIAELSRGRPAASSIMSRLSELLFVEAVRSYASTAPAEDAAWLRGISDPQIGRVLSMMHRAIGSQWSLDGLAREAGLSRTAFINRFTAATGLPPMGYLRSWRLRSARIRLREGVETVSSIAYSVGYESEEAFSRAFKKEYGISPGQYVA